MATPLKDLFGPEMVHRAFALQHKISTRDGWTVRPDHQSAETVSGCRYRSWSLDHRHGDVIARRTTSFIYTHSDEEIYS